MPPKRSRWWGPSTARAARICLRTACFAGRRSTSSSAGPIGIVALWRGTQKVVDVVQIDWRQPAYRLFEANLCEDRRVVRTRQVALRAVEQLLRVEHVHLCAHTDFLTQLGSIHRQPIGGDRLLQGFDFGETRVHREERLTHVLCNGAPCVLEVLFGS